jgi:regulator of sigma E protease
MPTLIPWISNNIVPFLVVLTLLVFVHELGHYWVARRCKVRVEVFSIGFGPEIYGWNDRVGTRWKLSLIPLGGYVKMFGEQAPADAGAPPMSEQDRAVSFLTKSVGRRAAIVVAGPAANFLFAIALLAGLYAVVGQPHTPSEITAVVDTGAGARAGIQPNDIIRKIDNVEIERFEQIIAIVRRSAGKELNIEVERGGQRIRLRAVPDTVTETTRFGTVETKGLLGVSRSGGGTVLKRYDPATAVWLAVETTVKVVGEIFDALWEIIKGTRSTSELGGPIRIAEMSAKMWQTSPVDLVLLAAMLSINLGLINLFPIPMLDGGHLLFFAVEAIRGRPLGERALEYSLRIGIAMVLALMVFATWNDLVQLKVFELIVDLVT